MIKYSIKEIDGQKYVVFNCSDGFDNWSQRKSAYKFKEGVVDIGWSWFCNTHAYTTSLEIAGYSLYSDKYPELPRFADKLSKFACEDPEVDAYFKAKAPAAWKLWDDAKKGLVPKEIWDKDGCAPLNIHTVLCYAANKFLGCEKGTISDFYQSYPLIDFQKEVVIKGLPIVTSGTYGNLAGHMVSVVGFAYKYCEVKRYLTSTEDFLKNVIEAGIKPAYTICDDPYGQTDNYKNNVVGNDSYVEYNKWVTMTKDVKSSDSKFAHVFKGALALV